MLQLTPEQVREYLQRVYQAADGLWFLKVEEKYDFETALDIDNEVWKVLPRIQARTLKTMGGLKDGPEAFRECIETRLMLDDYRFKIITNDRGAFDVVITECPWHNAMMKSGRAHLSSNVGRKICTTEYEAWIREFKAGLKFTFITRLCEGQPECVISFAKA